MELGFDLDNQERFAPRMEGDYVDPATDSFRAYLYFLLHHPSIALEVPPHRAGAAAMGGLSLAHSIDEERCVRRYSHR